MEVFPLSNTRGRVHIRSENNLRSRESRPVRGLLALQPGAGATTIIIDAEDKVLSQIEEM